MCKHIHHCGIICSSESVTRGEMKQSVVLLPPRSLRLLLILTTRGLHMMVSSVLLGPQVASLKGVLFQLFLGFPSGTFCGLFSLSHFLFIFSFYLQTPLKHCKHHRLLKHRAPSSISPQSIVECLHALKKTVIY